jgi:hypothetical protein
MKESSFNPTFLLSSFIEQNSSGDNERFLLFLKAYYEWLQTTRIQISDLVGTFVRDEEIVGSTSRSRAVVKEIGNGYLIVKVLSRYSFETDEIIIGETSDATANVDRLKDNVVRASGKLTEYRTIEGSIDEYVDYLQDELYSSIPVNFFGNKKLLASKFKEYFASKSNEESYRFLFKLLYNETIEIYYPGEDVLRVSNGKFEKTEIFRTVVTPRIFEFLNKTIRGRTTKSLANIVDIKIFFVGPIEVAEMTAKLVSGPFNADEQIEAINDLTLTTSLFGIISGFNIIDGGSGYQVGNPVVISGDGSQAQALVSSVGEGPISALSVNEIGHGYRLGTQALIDNTGTGGSGLIVRVTELANTYNVVDGANTYTVGEASRVSIINRGIDYARVPTITLVDTAISGLGLLSERLITIEDAGTDYGVGNSLIFTGGSGANAEGQVASVVETVTYDFLFEDGNRIILDGSVEDILKNEDWDVIGPIRRIELTNFGTGYTQSDLPTITIDTTTGSSANLVATNIQGRSANVTVDVANNVAGIGSIREIVIRNFGVNYSTANADVSASGDGNANIIPIISGLASTTGDWINDDGKIAYKFLQDSFFYQDFSYVIRSGLAFVDYAGILKRTIHPAGLQPFGEILLFDEIDVSPNFVVEIELRKILDLIVKIFSEFDVSVSIDPLNNQTNIGFTSSIDVPLVSLTSDYVVDIESIPSNAFSGENVNEYVIITKTDLDASSNFVEEVTKTYQFESQFDVPLEFDTKEYTIRQTNLLDAESNILKEYVISYDAQTNIGSEIEKQYTKFFKNDILAHGILFREIRISVIQDEQILTYQNSRFTDNFIGELQVFSSTIKNVKIGGTVTITGNNVVGTSTDFVTDFSANDSFIVNGEKFVVKSVSNSSFMQINVPPVGTYVNSSAFKEESA